MITDGESVCRDFRGLYFFDDWARHAQISNENPARVIDVASDYSGQWHWFKGLGTG